MTTKVPTYIETTHVCRTCGSGRILLQTNSGPTGGGNSISKCATCGKGGAVTTHSKLCYCGFQRFSEDPNIYSCWDVSKPIPEGWTQFRKVYNLLVIKTVRRNNDQRNL